MGPSTKDGFFYDFETIQNIHVKEEDYKSLEKEIKNITGKKYRFERLLLTKEEALDLFSYNKFKTQLIQNKVPDRA